MRSHSWCEAQPGRVAQETSLLKNSIAELYEEEKHRKSPSYETYAQEIGSKTW
jgi:hypothetical protein